tara:strand:- start:245 stop:358 length:114 start_codon:yes stop_codon:yes gene_type:complete
MLIGRPIFPQSSNEVEKKFVNLEGAQKSFSQKMKAKE